MGVDAGALAISIVSAVIALGGTIGSILYARRSANSAIDQAATAQKSADAAGVQADTAMRQLELSEQVRREQQEPHVVVDIRPSDWVDAALMLVIENIGSTVARNVRITCDPPLRRVAEREIPDRSVLMDSFIFNDGIPTMPPGRKIELFFDMGFELLPSGLPLEYAFTVTVDGPFGPVEPSTYKVDLRIYMGVQQLRIQNLHDGVKTLDKLRKAVEKIAKQTKPPPPAES